MSDVVANDCADGVSIGLRDISPTQWKSGIAAWLGWFFDGLDLHLYTIVAVPFVAQLLSMDPKSDAVREKSSWIQAAFLVGWALGGGLFGRVGDRLGRSRALMLTILTYAMFTGLAFFAKTWSQLMIFRFLAALGVGGEWAVGASLLTETWPISWRHWMAAVLQSGVNLGVMLAMLAGFILLSLLELPNRSVFLVGILPALMVLWIRHAVPEPAEWKAAMARSHDEAPRFIELFKWPIGRITFPALLVCALSLTAHWAFMFWFPQQLRNLPDVVEWSEPEKSRLVILGLTLVMTASIAGNFLAALMSSRIGYRVAVATMCLLYFVMMTTTYATPRNHQSMLLCLTATGICQGVFALFTMYLPPLFPPLLRTSGAGFCFNIGRIAAAVGTVYSGSFVKHGDFSDALFYASFLFLPAVGFALLLPELPKSGAGVSA